MVQKVQALYERKDSNDGTPFLYIIDVRVTRDGAAGIGDVCLRDYPITTNDDLMDMIDTYAPILAQWGYLHLRLSNDW